MATASAKGRQHWGLPAHRWDLDRYRYGHCSYFAWIVLVRHRLAVIVLSLYREEDVQYKFMADSDRCIGAVKTARQQDSKTAISLYLQRGTMC